MSKPSQPSTRTWCLPVCCLKSLLSSPASTIVGGSSVPLMLGMSSYTNPTLSTRRQSIGTLKVLSNWQRIWGFVMLHDLMMLGEHTITPLVTVFSQGISGMGLRSIGLPKYRWLEHCFCPSFRAIWWPSRSSYNSGEREYARISFTKSRLSFSTIFTCISLQLPILPL